MDKEKEILLAIHGYENSEQWIYNSGYRKRVKFNNFGVATDLKIDEVARMSVEELKRRLVYLDEMTLEKFRREFEVK